MPDPDETTGDTTDETQDAPAGRPGRARGAALIGLRVVAGTVGIVASVALIGAVGLLPLPSHRIAVPSVTITPDPADQLRVCPGALLRLGDESGQNANTPLSLGAPAITRGGIGAELTSLRLELSDAGTAGGASAPEVLTLPPVRGATLAGAQSQ